MQAVGGGMSGMAAQFSDKSELEVCIHVMRYRNRRLYSTLLFLSLVRTPRTTYLMRSEIRLCHS